MLRWKFVSTCVMVLFLLTACQLLSTGITGRPADTVANTDLIREQFRKEVCANIPYVTWDSTTDSKDTVDQLQAQAQVLYSVYKCPLPEGPKLPA